jgi:hypothetical protein
MEIIMRNSETRKNEYRFNVTMRFVQNIATEVIRIQFQVVRLTFSLYDTQEPP